MYLFSRTLGLDEAKASISQAIASRKFPHALLIHGPAGVGQIPMLLDLADILICEATDSRPCGQCGGCLGRKHNNLDNLVFVIPMEKKKKEKEKDKDSEKSHAEGEGDGVQTDELTEMVKELHQDPYGFTHTEKSAINVAQVRELQGRLSFAEVSKRPRIVIMPWVETMAHEAANTLLKTLEEPPPNTYFLLSSDDRSSLLPTILSRCTQLIALPMESDAMGKLLTLHAKRFEIKSVSTRLLPFAEGSLGVALNLHRNGGEPLLDEAGKFWETSLSGDWRAFADFLETADSFQDMEGASRMIPFLLRMVRLFHRLETLEGRDPLGQKGRAKGTKSRSYLWTEQALRNQGFDPDLAPILGPLEHGPKLEFVTEWLGEILSAVQSYAKPKVAALGLYLDFELKNTARKESLPC